MRTAYILRDLLRFESETAQTLEALDTTPLELRFVNLIRDAVVEHTSRAERIKAELRKLPDIIGQSDVQLTPSWFPSTTDDCFSVAESAEIRLDNLYGMSRVVTSSPLVKELAEEETALKERFGELKRSITIKMRAIS